MIKVTREDALAYHSGARKGKIEVVPTKPTATQGDALAAHGHAPARALAEWKSTVAAGWPGIRIHHVEIDDSVADLGSERSVEVVVALGTLTPSDVQVQLLHGPAGQSGELSSPQTVTLEQVGSPADGQIRYRGHFACQRAGRYGVTVRVVPTHPCLVSPTELGLIAWA